MEIFQKAKTVRLLSHHDKYLLADDDEEGVYQDRNGSCKNAIWTVEVLENVGVLRLKSVYGKYLSASNMPYFFGVSGKKVVQSLPRRLDSSLEWEPIREGMQVKLMTRYGHYLRANGGVPPLRNSITHDIPHRSSTQDWILWDVDIVEFQKPSQCQEPDNSQQASAPARAQQQPRQQSPEKQHVKVQTKPWPQQHFRAQEPPPPLHANMQAPRSPEPKFRAEPPLPPPDFATESPPSSPEQHFRAQPPPPPPHLREQTQPSPQQQFRAQPPPPPPHLSEQTPPSSSNVTLHPPPEPTSPPSFSLKSPRNEDYNKSRPSPVNEGRLIVYEVMDDNGEVIDKSKGEDLSFTFKGSGVEELKQIVKGVTGIDDIIVCTRNPLNGKPYPLRLHLPPNNATMNLVVVPSTSKLARDLK